MGVVIEREVEKVSSADANTSDSFINDKIENIINKYSNTVFQLALAKTKNKEMAEDIFQEVFIKFIKRKRVFESTEHENAWIIRVTLNCCKDLWNSAWLRHTVPLEEYQENKATMDSNKEAIKFRGETYQQISITNGNNEDVYIAVMNLSEKYRIPIHLFYYEELSVAEIGKVLKVNQNTIATRLKRAREILKKKLDKEDFYD